MTYEPPELTPAEKQFAGACEEQAWQSALDLIPRISGQSAEAFARNPALSLAHTTLLTEASDEVIGAWRETLKLTRFSRQRIGAFRQNAIVWLSQGHIDLAMCFLEDRRFDAGYFHIASAIEMLPRSHDHECLLSSAVATFIAALGQVEATHARERPDLELDPAKIAPHPARIYAMAETERYDALAGADLIRRGIDACCSKAFVVHTLQTCFQDAHWPSFRACMLLGTDRSNAVKPAADVIAKESLPLSPGARAHLEALINGAHPNYEIVGPDTWDDCPF